jgi:hypothetical protein
MVAKTKTTLYFRLLLQAKRPLRLGAPLGQARWQQEGRHQRFQQQNERGDWGSLVLPSTSSGPKTQP